MRHGEYAAHTGRRSIGVGHVGHGGHASVGLFHQIPDAPKVSVLCMATWKTVATVSTCKDGHGGHAHAMGEGQVGSSFWIIPLTSLPATRSLPLDRRDAHRYATRHEESAHRPTTLASPCHAPAAARRSRLRTGPPATSRADGHSEADAARAPGARLAASAAWRAVGDAAAGWAIRRDAGHLARPAHPRRDRAGFHVARRAAHARIHCRAVPAAALPDQPARQRQRHLPALRPATEVSAAEPEWQPHSRRGRDARPSPREPAQRVTAGHAGPSG